MKIYVNPNDLEKRPATTSIIGSLALGASVFLLLPLTQGIAPGAVPLPPIAEEPSASTDLPPPPKPPEPPREKEDPEEERPELKFRHVDPLIAIEPIPGGIPVWTPNPGSLGPGRIVDAWSTPGQLDNDPRATLRVSPIYPYPLKGAGTEGYADLNLSIDERGRVVAATLRKASHREFGEAALKVIYRWKFEPGTINGEPAKVMRVQRIAFTLR